jgi:hypothetical protein
MQLLDRLDQATLDKAFRGELANGGDKARTDSYDASAGLLRSPRPRSATVAGESQ